MTARLFSDFIGLLFCWLVPFESTLFQVLNHLIRPRLALVAREPFVCVLVIDELLLVRVPLQFPTQPDRNDAQVADRDRAMSDLCIANRLFPGTDAFEEISHVI